MNNNNNNFLTLNIREKTRGKIFVWICSLDNKYGKWTNDWRHKIHERHERVFSNIRRSYSNRLVRNISESGI